MGVAGRLTTAGGGDIQSGIPLAPADIDRDTATGIYDTGLALRPSADAELDANSLFRDMRPNQVQVITMTNYSGGDEFVLSAVVDGENLGNTIAFTHGTDAAAADIQTALRTLLGDSCTVTGTTNAGPYTVTFLASDYSRHFPTLVVVSNTGCTATIANSTDAQEAIAGQIGALGESHRVNETDTILAPTIGTITVTDAVDEVDTLTYEAGTDGGTFALKWRAQTTGDLAWDVTVEDLTALVEECFQRDPNYEVTDAPTIAITTGAEVATIDLGDIGAADTFKLTYDSNESTDLITYAATLTTEIQAAVDELIAASSAPGDTATVAKVDSNTYTVTKGNAAAFQSTFTVTTVTGFTAKGDGGYTDGGKITSAAGDLVWTFTFENGVLAGSNVSGFVVEDDSTTDGGVAQTLVFATGTPGVLGSISAAYTENGAGDTVIAAAIHDTTGQSYGFAGDAATPVAIASLPTGTYHLVLRTVEDGRVSKGASKAFTVASA